MPLPLILAGLGWIIGPAILGGGAGYGIAVLVESLLNDVNHIAVLGRCGTGKTTLIHYMRDGIIRDYPNAETTGPEKFEAFSTTIGDKKIRIGSGRDVPGVPNYYSDWKAEFKSATHVLYLMDVHTASADIRYRKSILNDIKKLCAWCEDADRDPEQSVPKIRIVGTHCDLIERTLSEKRGEFEERVKNNSGFEKIMMTIEKYVDKVRVVFGCLRDSDAADDMLSKIFSDERRD